MTERLPDAPPESAAPRPDGPLRALDLSVMDGANYYSGSPIVVLRLDLAEYDEVFTHAITGFHAALKSRLPSLHEHHCSVGRPGGFFERVAEGTLLGHVTEHVAIELQTLAGMDVGFGKTRATRTPGIYNVVYRFDHEAAGRAAGRMAVNLVNSILAGGEFDVAGTVRTLRDIQDRDLPDPFTRTILDIAKERRIPVQRMAESDLLILGTGNRQRRIGSGLDSGSGALGMSLANDRLRWLALLEEAGIPVCPYAAVNSPVKAVEFQVRSKRSVRVFPVRSRETELPPPLSDVSEISNAFREAARNTGRAVVQTVPAGTWRDILVVAGRALRTENAGSASMGGNEAPAGVSSEGMDIFLRETAVRAARWIGLDPAMVTMAVPGDADPPGRVVDIRSAGASLPELDEEAGAKAARLVMDRLFPEGTASRVRLVGITGSRGVSGLAARLALFFQASGRKTGRVGPDGCFVAEKRFPGDGEIGADSVRRLVREPDLDAAVVAVPPERILARGLPYDWAEVGVVLNVGEMPPGFDYLRNEDDFAHALCVVPEKVLEGGLAVLNADDPRVLKMAERAKGRVILFSADYHNAAMRAHADRGEASVVLDGDEIVGLRGRERIRLVEKVGAGLGGDRSAGGPSVSIVPEDREVLLAFVAVAWGLGMVVEERNNLLDI